jgi:DNA polymerase-3 subunit delta
MTTTVLVFCYKYKTLDKRKKLAKKWCQLKVKLYDNQVGDWIKRVWQARNMRLNQG